MLPYWLLFAVWAAGAIQFAQTADHPRNPLLLGVISALTALMIGLRFEVGGDWGNYQRIFDDISLLSFRDALAYGDPAYTGLNAAAASVGLGIVSVNLICGAIFTWGVARFALRQPNPWLAILIGVPYFIIVVAMGYTRQATAIGIIMAGLAVASEKTIVRTVIYVIVAALFHKTAVLALPVIGVAMLRKRPFVGLLGVIGFTGAYLVLLSGSTDALMTNYVEADYDSQGAVIRVIMDILAGGLFFIFRKSLGFDDYQRALWSAFAIASFVCFVALFIGSGRAAIDRVALFLIPLQLIVYGRLPYAITRSSYAHSPALFAVIAYSAVVQFVWLNYADNAWGWVPYRAAPFASASRF